MEGVGGIERLRGGGGEEGTINGMTDNHKRISHSRHKPTSRRAGLLHGIKHIPMTTGQVPGEF